MNKLDMLLLKAKLRNGKMYLLVGFMYSDGNLYSLNLNLHKFGECIENYDEKFDTVEDANTFIENISNQYSIAEGDVLIFYMDYGEESG